MTRHLDCPSAPLGEVEPVRLGLVLGEDVGLDLILVDPLDLVLGGDVLRGPVEVVVGEGAQLGGHDPWRGLVARQVAVELEVDDVLRALLAVQEVGEVLEAES